MSVMINNMTEAGSHAGNKQGAHEEGAGRQERVKTCPEGSVKHESFQQAVEKL